MLKKALDTPAEVAGFLLVLVGCALAYSDSISDWPAVTVLLTGGVLYTGARISRISPQGVDLDN